MEYFTGGVIGAGHYGAPFMMGYNMIELLSPAGSYESMVAAVNAGCDAIYIGGRLFGARAFADNLSNERMIEAIEYMHARGKRIYLTINTLFKENELKDMLYDYLLPFYEKGIDGVIVQDMGVVRFIHRNFQGLNIHASTQMTITMAEGAEVLKNYGITRFVAARELMLDELMDMRKKTDLEIEAFIHGALCYSYSGQCLLSSFIGGRSGNRGKCAQPCRMPYTISGHNKSCILSPKDMCTLNMIPDLMESGIDSFKIEGRMKRYEYTAGVTRIYRKYMDLYNSLGLEDYIKYVSKHKAAYEDDDIELKDLYNRGGFCEGYYKQQNGRSMMSMERPNHDGVLVGKVIQVFKSSMEIEFTKKVNPQDILEIRHINMPQNINKPPFNHMPKDLQMPLYEFTLKDGNEKGGRIIVNYMHGSHIKAGQMVYRTKNNSLLHRLHEEYYLKEKKLGVCGYFYAEPEKPIFMEAFINTGTGMIRAKAEGIVAQQASKHPITREKALQQIIKTSDTAYYFDKLDIDIKGDVFLPISGINELRREVLHQLKEKMIAMYERKHDKALLDHNLFASKGTTDYQAVPKEKNYIDKPYVNHADHQPELCVSVVNMEQLREAAGHHYIQGIYFDITDALYTDIKVAANIVKSSGKAFYLIFPHIFRKKSYDEYKENSACFDRADIDGYYIRNLEQYYFLTKELGWTEIKKELRSDCMMYAFNHEAACFLKELGISRITAPLELNHKELLSLGIPEMELICYGRLPLMISAQCISKNTGGCIKHTKKSMHHVFLDRMNKELSYAMHCGHCYNEIVYNEPYNSLNHITGIKKLNPKSIRLSFTTEAKETVNKIITMAYEAFSYLK